MAILSPVNLKNTHPSHPSHSWENQAEIIYCCFEHKPQPPFEAVDNDWLINLRATVSDYNPYPPINALARIRNVPKDLTFTTESTHLPNVHSREWENRLLSTPTPSLIRDGKFKRY